jgi:hypothetical protein
MCSPSAPTPPTPPDPIAVGSAQQAGDINSQIAGRYLNNTNQVTPYGNLNYSQSGSQKITLPNGQEIEVPNFTATQTLNPQQQATLDQTQGAQYGLAKLANDQTGRVAQVLGNQLNFNGQPSMVTGLDQSQIPGVPSSVDAGEFLQLQQFDPSQLQQTPSSIDTSQATGLPSSIDTSLATSGVPRGIDMSSLGMLSHGVDTSGLPQQVTGLNPNGLSAMPGSPQQINQQVSDALYGQATSRLDPQWQQQQQLLQDQLTQQGIPVGSQAYTTAMDNFSRAKNDAYTSAQNAATVSGAQLGQQDYGLALQGRQQGVSEQTTNASLASQAAQLGLSEQQLQAAISSGTVGQIIAAQQANAGVANQAAQTSVGAQKTNADVAAQAAQIGVGAQVANAGVANQSAQTQLAQKMAASQNTLANNQFLLGYQGQNAATANQAAQLAMQKQTTNAGLAQTARQQGISEQQYLYNLPLNQTSALLSGSQVQGPQFVNTPQSQIAGPNMLGAYALQNQGQQANYQAQMQNYGAGIGGLFGLAGAGLTAGLSGGLGGFGSSAIGALFK